MAVTKETEKVEAEKVVIVGSTSAQAAAPKSNQTVITIAIVSGVILFFVGIGLGYLLGHSTSSRRLPTDGIQLPGDRDGSRRLYLNSDKNGSSSSDDSNTNTNTNTNTKTQTN